MALGDGGLDAQVEQRMDAYRGNPQKLQQRYGQNKELLDLLALQKLTSEKKQVAADMQLKAQQNPNTIAQQREAEALELTKSAMGGSLSELAGRTKGTLDQKAAMQKKNMNRMAQGAGKPQMGGGAGLAGLMGKPRPNVPPQAQGLAGARMAQAAQQAGGPVRMAGGGIVAFAAGEGVSGQSGLFSKGRKLTLDEKAAFQKKFGGMADRLINQVEKGSVSGLSVGKDTQQQIADILGESLAPETDSGVDPLRLANPGGLQDTGVPLSEAMLPPAVDNSTTQRPDDGSLNPAGGIQSLVPPTETLDDGLRTNAGNQPVVSNVAPQTGDTPLSTNVMGTVNDLSSDVAMQKGFDRADEHLKRDEANQSYEDMKSQLAAFDQENYNPNEDVNNFLIGMGGTGSMGAAMRGGKSAMDAGVRNRRNRLMDNLSLEIKRLSNDATLGTKGIELGRALAQDAAANERNMRTEVSAMTRAEMQMARSNADRQAKRDEALLVSWDKKQSRDVEILRDDTQRLNIKMGAAYKISDDLRTLRITLLDNAETNSEMLLTVQGELDDAVAEGKSQKLITALEKDKATVIRNITAQVEEVLNTARDGETSPLALGEAANEFISKQIDTNNPSEMAGISQKFSGATLGGYKETETPKETTFYRNNR
jgi:hypothetical protein